MKEWWGEWYNKYAVLAVSAIFGIGAYQYVCWSRLSRSDWAAWVQAIGSILALAVAIGLAIWQRHEENRRREIAATGSRKKAQHVANVAVGLVRDAICDLAEISKTVALNVYRDGMVERMRDQRLFLAGLQLADLNADEVAAIARVRDGCSAAIAVMLRPIDGDDVLSRMHISTTATEILSQLDAERSMLTSV